MEKTEAFSCGKERCGETLKRQRKCYNTDLPVTYKSTESGMKLKRLTSKTSRVNGTNYSFNYHCAQASLLLPDRYFSSHGQSLHSMDDSGRHGHSGNISPLVAVFLCNNCPQPLWEVCCLEGCYHVR